MRLSDMSTILRWRVFVISGRRMITFSSNMMSDQSNRVISGDPALSPAKAPRAKNGTRAMFDSSASLSMPWMTSFEKVWMDFFGTWTGSSFAIGFSFVNSFLIANFQRAESVLKYRLRVVPASDERMDSILSPSISDTGLSQIGLNRLNNDKVCCLCVALWCACASRCIITRS
jgi:hypothetical protein